jgi:hypothetical protein
VVQNTHASVSGCSQLFDMGLVGCGATGAFGVGTAEGVNGKGNTYGVFGQSSSGTGVYGNTSAEAQNGRLWTRRQHPGGSGVYGQNDGRATGSQGGPRAPMADGRAG